MFQVINLKLHVLMCSVSVFFFLLLKVTFDGELDSKKDNLEIYLIFLKLYLSVFISSSLFQIKAIYNVRSFKKIGKVDMSFGMLGGVSLFLYPITLFLYSISFKAKYYYISLPLLCFVISGISLPLFVRFMFLRDKKISASRN